MTQIGTIIDGKYKILEKIGQGGMSYVYLAMDNHLNKQWAVKEIRKQGISKNNQVVVQSLLAEANLMKRLDHPALPRIVDIIDNGKTIYVVMDYIEGESLNRVLEEYGPQDQALVIEWGKQLCEVLDYLHTRTPPIIYRDMKPANVMLRPEGNIKLIDFGIAREYKEEQSRDTISLGTKEYAAPEQLNKDQQTDARTDIYCLGATLYQLLTGKTIADPPYELIPIRRWNPLLSAGLEKIITKCTQPNPDDRYQTCAELLFALEHYEQMDDSYRAVQKKKLNRFVLAAGAAAASLAIGITCSIGSVQVRNSTYASKLAAAGVSTLQEEKIGYLLEAVEILPAETDAYHMMVDVFKEDAGFSVEEQAILQKSLTANLDELRENENYRDLAFDVGKLYWFYYEYGQSQDGDNQLTRMKSAIQWFEDAANYGGTSHENYNMALIYSNIGKFNRDITLEIEEASDKGKYAPYWAELESLVAVASENSDESEIVLLELYRLVLNSIESYARKFRADEITQEQMQTMFDTCRTQISGIEPMTDKTIALKEYLESRLVYVQEAITLAFER